MEPLLLRLSQRSSETAEADDEIWAVTEASGLLPAIEPLSADQLPAEWTVVHRLCRTLPAACVPPATFCDHVRSQAAALGRIRVASLSGAAERERARTLLAYVLAGWHAALPHAGAGGEPAPLGSVEALPLAPAPLRILFGEVSVALGRAPRLGLTDTILFNWHLREAAVDPAGGGGHGGARHAGEAPPAEPSSPHADAARGRDRPTLGTMGQVVPCVRFLCVEEEDWFVRLHVTLASEFGRVVAAARACRGAKSIDARLRSLQQLEQAIHVLVQVLLALPAACHSRAVSSSSCAHLVASVLRSAHLSHAPPRARVQVHYAAGVGQHPGQTNVPNVRPALLQQRQHRFWEEHSDLPLQGARLRAARVYCATGIDQSCLLHLLGVARGGHAMETYRSWLEAVDGELPASHRAFLIELRVKNPSMRELVEREVGVRKLSVQELARFELAHNNCIDMLLRYFTRRWELVRTMFGEEVAGPLSVDWEHERSLIQEARLRLLIERRCLAWS